MARASARGALGWPFQRKWGALTTKTTTGAPESARGPAIVEAVGPGGGTQTAALGDQKVFKSRRVGTSRRFGAGGATLCHYA